MSKLEQDHFLDKLRRSITPTSERKEPAIWFKEVRILDEFSTRQGIERQRISMHRGLNILWAAPENPDTEQGLYKDGLAGHASGKTLFCRLLRHFMGEREFGTKEQRDEIASQFPNLWALALIRLNGDSWVVGRPLGQSGDSFAVKAESIDEVLGNSPPVGGFDDYTRAIKTLGQAVEPLHPGEGWRHLLTWLTRDQEARFGNLAVWREASSGGDNPQTKAIERHLLMRSVLGLLDLREPVLRSAIEKTQADLEAGESLLARMQNEYNGQIQLANDRAREILGSEAPTEPELLETRLQSMTDVLREGAEELLKRPEHPTVTAARQRLDTARQELRDVEQELQRLPEMIDQRKKSLDIDLSTARKIKNGNVEDPTREDKNWCPKTRQFALEKGCVKQAGASTESALNVADLEKRAEESQRELAALETRRAHLTGLIAGLRKSFSDADAALRKAQMDSNRDATNLVRRAERAESGAKLFRQLSESKKAIDAKTKQNATWVKEIEEKRKASADLRSDFTEKLERFSADFADIIQAVMGATVEAKISVTGEGFVPHVTRKGELSGAALDTIKTLAFDIGAVVSSIEGRGDHPRFLIHDGPREGDMARIIYERFFLYAAEMEAAFSSQEVASFQYLITTTTPPPKSMRQGSAWLLEPVLDSRERSKRLLKEDF
jgi:hypothetical protein